LDPFWDYWYFHLPNYLLAALLYTLVGRFILSLFVPVDWPNYIWRNFCRLTDPVLAAVGFITPRMIGHLVLLLIAAYWMLVLRVIFTTVMHNLGATPALAGS